MSSLFSRAILVGGQHYPSQSEPNQASAPGVSHFIDGSGPIFSMYLERAKEVDEKMAEHWKADAEGILIFVRTCSSPMLHTDSSVIDWFILRRCCFLDFGVNSGHPAESTGHLQLLPCQYLSNFGRPESAKYILPFFSPSVHSTNICRLGERALVHELDYQYYLCSTRDIATAVGTTIPEGDSTTLQSTQTGPDARVLC